MEKKIRDSYNDSILQEAMCRYGIAPGDITLLDGFESFIYTFHQGTDSRILRLSHSLHRDAVAIRGEVDWLAYLAEHGVPVAYAVPSLSGEMVEVLADGDAYFCATAFIYAPGQPPQREDWENGLLRQVGQMLAKMNTLAQGYSPRDPRAKRPHLIADITGFERFLPPEEAPVAEKFRQVVSGLAQLPTRVQDYGLVHQDFHGGNFHLKDGQITLFDFDDALYGWFAYDVAMALMYVLPLNAVTDEDLAFARSAWGELIEGYSSVRRLSAFWRSKIPMFMKLREIDLYIAIHRSMDLSNLDPWCASYMENRREKILNDVPFVDIQFT